MGTVEWELYPGVTAAIDLAAEDGGWVCEQHPDQPFEHDDCPGPGMLRSDAVRHFGEDAVGEGLILS